MSEYKKEDIKNLHYNNNNEIQYEYGGQIYHCSMEHLKEVLVTCWNLQQEKQQLKQVLLDMKEYIETECSKEYCTNSRLYITDGLKKDLIFKINKVLGSDNNG